MNPQGPCPWRIGAGVVVATGLFFLAYRSRRADQLAATVAAAAAAPIGSNPLNIPPRTAPNTPQIA